jgi:hypothetical protein
MGLPRPDDIIQPGGFRYAVDIQTNTCPKLLCKWAHPEQVIFSFWGEAGCTGIFRQDAFTLEVGAALESTL